MIIRSEQPDDRDAVDALVIAAFGDHGPTVALLVADLRQVIADGSGESLVADDGGQVVGHVLLSPGFVDADERVVDVLVLSPLGVRPDRQGQGVGGSLVRAALEAAAERRSPAVFLEGDPRYYSRFGFRPGGAVGFTPPSPRIPDPAFQVVTLPAHEPWMTGALVYDAAFWRHDCVGLRNPAADPSP